MIDHIRLSDCYRGCLLGLAAGDAVGTAVEFQRRGTFKPVTDMAGGGPFRLAPGQWTDDTSMALCLAASLVERNGFDPADQMERYCRWKEQGYFSSTGTCFDIGTTTDAALLRYLSCLLRWSNQGVNDMLSQLSLSWGHYNASYWGPISHAVSRMRR